MSRRDPIHEALVAEIAAWPGVQLTKPERRGKHPGAKVCFAGRALPIFWPGTPSDHRSIPNQVRDLRRVLLVLGAQREGRR